MELETDTRATRLPPAAAPLPLRGPRAQTQQVSERLRGLLMPKATSGAFHLLSVPFRLVLLRETESKGPQGVGVRVTKRLP